ncbi:HNH endonuclease [Cytobacillus sp. FSL R5-0596]|uniref:HNH endonuclease n=1 Tax=Cytobacillus sp. FSL R5-0596 TaxID=2954696 RepID=UPI0030F948B5
MFEYRPAPKPSYKRRVDKRVDRNKFTKHVRDQIKDHFEDTCQMCGGRGCHIHHVQPKGSGKGRGVFTNGLLLCNPCHKKVHADDRWLRYWKEVFKEKHGPDYYKDEEDLNREYQDKKMREIQDSLEY